MFPDLSHGRHPACHIEPLLNGLANTVLYRILDLVSTLDLCPGTRLKNHIKPKVQMQCLGEGQSCNTCNRGFYV